jgi:hypothetical protein
MVRPVIIMSHSAFPWADFDVQTEYAICFNLQRLFAGMQLKTDKSLSRHTLIQAFGWDTSQARMQREIHEFWTFARDYQGIDCSDDLFGGMAFFAFILRQRTRAETTYRATCSASWPGFRFGLELPALYRISATRLQCSRAQMLPCQMRTDFLKFPKILNLQLCHFVSDEDTSQYRNIDLVPPFPSQIGAVTLCES